MQNYTSNGNHQFIIQTAPKGAALFSVPPGRFLFIYLAVLALSYRMWDLVPRRGIEPKPSVLGAWSLNHWTSKEVSQADPEVIKLGFLSEHENRQFIITSVLQSIRVLLTSKAYLQLNSILLW